MKVRIALIVAVSLALSPSTAKAKTVDFATMSEVGGPYEVSFCARPSPSASGFPGHAFVAFSEGSSNSRKFMALGLTVQDGANPIAAALSYFGDGVGGVVREEQYSHIRQECLTVRVNRSIYRAAYSQSLPSITRMGLTTEGLARFESYRLGSNDCITFASEVAATLVAAGLQVPERKSTDLPIDFIQKIQNLN